MSASLRLAERPFYASRLVARRPRPWTLEDLEDFAARDGDPYGGRLLPGAGPPPVSLQLEACDEPPLWVGLAPRELAAWSRVLEGIWRRYGLRAGDRVAFFDYGSSPLVLLAAGSYAPYLRQGVAERLGVSVICNDGVASLGERMLEIVERLRPAALILRRDVIAPFAEWIERSGIDLADSCRFVAVSEVEGIPSQPELARLRETWGVPVHRFARADAAFFLAGECASCDAFHVDPRSYRVETVEDAVAVTARFARLCPAVRHRLDGAERLSSPCRRDPEAVRLRWA